MAATFEQWYLDIPVVTRTFLTLSTLTAVAVTFDLLSPLSLYLNFDLVLKEGQVWRLVTTFLFFDGLSVNFVFHAYFLYFYCRRLEEHHYHQASADFLFMILLGAAAMLSIAPFLALPFLSHSLVIMVLYVWSRRNPHEQLQLYGLFTVGASYLAYVLVALGIMMGQHPLVDILGIVIGHIYYYLTDVLPVAFDGIQIIRTPYILRVLMGEHRTEDMEDIELDDSVDGDEEETLRRVHHAAGAGGDAPLDGGGARQAAIPNL